MDAPAVQVEGLFRLQGLEGPDDRRGPSAEARAELGLARLEEERDESVRARGEGRRPVRFTGRDDLGLAV